MEQVNQQVKMTEQQAIDAIQMAVENMSTESAHIECDDIITKFLRVNGYEVLADKFDSVCGGFWYS